MKQFINYPITSEPFENGALTTKKEVISYVGLALKMSGNAINTFVTPTQCKPKVCTLMIPIVYHPSGF